MSAPMPGAMPSSSACSAGLPPPSGSGGTPLVGLPTLQRNALCKLFERSDFTPREVAEVGYGRLQRVSGIGPKGLEIIRQWAAQYGVELGPEQENRAGRLSQRVERAIRLLQRLGYEVRQPAASLPESAHKGKANKQIRNQSFRPG